MRILGALNKGLAGYRAFTLSMRYGENAALRVYMTR